MTKEQLDHYMKGGYFTAIYTPIVIDDLSHNNLSMTSKEIDVYQNVLNYPTPNQAYPQQFAFNSDDIYGWFPEQDIKIVRIQNRYLDFPESTKRYMYKIYYHNHDSILKNFGIGYENTKLPLIVTRAYTTESDEYILQLSKPPAELIRKGIWNYEKSELEIIWEDFAKDGKVLDHGN